MKCYAGHCNPSDNTPCYKDEREELNQYSKTCDVLCFDHQVYELRNELLISNHKSFVLIGNSTIITCHNSQSLQI